MSDLSIATAIIQRIVETGKNNGPDRNSSGCHHERSGRGNEPFRIESVGIGLGDERSERDLLSSTSDHR